MTSSKSCLKNFGTIVRQYRTRLGLSQEKLAARAHLHRTYVGAIERGERNISLRTIFLLASALDIEASEMLEEL